MQRSQSTALAKDSKNRSFALSLVNYLYECRNKTHRTIFTAATQLDEVVIMVEEFLDGLEELPITYTRNSYINDLIILMKAGNAGVAKPLADTMGFNQTSNDLCINIIDFSTVKDSIVESEEPDPCGR